MKNRAQKQKDLDALAEQFKQRECCDARQLSRT